MGLRLGALLLIASSLAAFALPAGALSLSLRPSLPSAAGQLPDAGAVTERARDALPVRVVSEPSGGPLPCLLPAGWDEPYAKARGGCVV